MYFLSSGGKGLTHKVPYIPMKVTFHLPSVAPFAKRFASQDALGDVNITDLSSYVHPCEYFKPRITI